MASFSWSILVVAMLTVGCTSAVPVPGGFSPSLSYSRIFESSEPSGISLIPVDFSDGGFVRWNVVGQWKADSLNPYSLFFVHSNGTVTELFALAEQTPPRDLNGPGMIAVRAGPVALETPEFLPGRVLKLDGGGVREMTGSGVVIFLWYGSAVPIHIQLASTHRFHEDQEFEGHAEAGDLRSVEGTGVDSPLILSTKGSQTQSGEHERTCGVFAWAVSDGGAGHAQVQIGGEVHDFDMTRLPASGLSFERSRSYFCGTGPVSATIDYAGNSRSTRVVLLSGSVPSAAAPNAWWSAPVTRGE